VNPQRSRKYLTVFGSGKHVGWYHTRAWWGTQWDLRSTKNKIVPPVERGSHGLWIDFRQYRECYLNSFLRPVL
jgi:hypothetical protein